MYGSTSGFLYFSLFIGGIIFLLFINTQINNHIEKRATELFEKEKYKLEREKREHLGDLEKKRRVLLRVVKENYLKDKAELAEYRETLDRENLYREKLFAEKTQGFPWAADAFSTLRTAYLDMIEWELEHKDHPAFKAAETVKEVKKHCGKVKDALFQLRLLSISMRRYSHGLLISAMPLMG